MTTVTRPSFRGVVVLLNSSNFLSTGYHKGLPEGKYARVTTKIIKIVMKVSYLG